MESITLVWNPINMDLDLELKNCEGKCKSFQCLEYKKSSTICDESLG